MIPHGSYSLDYFNFSSTSTCTQKLQLGHCWAFICKEKINLLTETLCFSHHASHTNQEVEEDDDDEEKEEEAENHLLK